MQLYGKTQRIIGPNNLGFPCTLILTRFKISDTSALDGVHMTFILRKNCTFRTLLFLTISLYKQGRFVYASSHQICMNL